jgi:hypothetical protein
MRYARHLVTVALALLGTTGLSACGGSAAPTVTSPARLERVPGSSTGRIVLTPVGAERIGLRTATVGHSAKRGRKGPPRMTIPFSAIVYAPNGRAYAFVSPRRLVFREVALSVDHIAGGVAYLKRGPPPGTRVVSVGAEELFGVQTGVLEET